MSEIYGLIIQAKKYLIFTWHFLDIWWISQNTFANVNSTNTAFSSHRPQFPNALPNITNNVRRIYISRNERYNLIHTFGEKLWIHWSFKWNTNPEIEVIFVDISLILWISSVLSDHDYWTELSDTPYCFAQEQRQHVPYCNFWQNIPKIVRRIHNFRENYGFIHDFSKNYLIWDFFPKFDVNDP